MSSIPSVRIADAVTDDFVDEAKALVVEYAESLDYELCFQGFADEMSEFPGDYGPPSGFMLLALVDEAPGGCIGIRRVDDDTCEMKRLYVKKEHRGLKVGRSLAEAAMERARQIGYKKMRLDVIENMKAAVSLYRSLGFESTVAYHHNPIEGALYLELDL